MNPLVYFLIFFFSNLHIPSRVDGFTIDLIHYDSHLSPFYNKSATMAELARNDAIRSIARANRLAPSSSSDADEKIDSPVIPAGGGYLMQLSIGSPPVEALAVADTGSDLVWIQCQPCDNCYPQDAPYFDPTKSSTYKELSCDSEPCQALQRRQCGSANNECQYSYRYGDQSYTRGILATDTITFDSSSVFPNSALGCGNNNNGTFTSRGSGLVGLGGGQLSLITQLGDKIDQKFSYCLVPRTANSAGKLKLGADSAISGGGVVSTPLVSKDPPTYYYLTLEGASVGDGMIESGGEAGNIIIDSGTTLTMLESSFYNKLEAAVKQNIGLNPVDDPNGPFRLCYSASTLPEMSVVFHFTGADVTLKGENIFIDLGNNLICLSLLPTDRLPVFGNLAQINFQVEYDLAKKQVSFAPADCTQQ